MTELSATDGIYWCGWLDEDGTASPDGIHQDFARLVGVGHGRVAVRVRAPSGRVDFDLSVVDEKPPPDHAPVDELLWSSGLDGRFCVEDDAGLAAELWVEPGVEYLILLASEVVGDYERHRLTLLPARHVGIVGDASQHDESLSQPAEDRGAAADLDTVAQSVRGVLAQDTPSSTRSEMVQLSAQIRMPKEQLQRLLQSTWAWAGDGHWNEREYGVNLAYDVEFVAARDAVVSAAGDHRYWSRFTDGMLTPGRRTTATVTTVWVVEALADAASSLNVTLSDGPADVVLAMQACWGIWFRRLQEIALDGT